MPYRRIDVPRKTVYRTLFPGPQGNITTPTVFSICDITNGQVTTLPVPGDSIGDCNGLEDSIDNRFFYLLTPLAFCTFDKETNTFSAPAAIPTQLYWLTTDVIPLPNQKHVLLAGWDEVFHMNAGIYEWNLAQRQVIRVLQNFPATSLIVPILESTELLCIAANAISVYNLERQENRPLVEASTIAHQYQTGFYRLGRKFWLTEAGIRILNPRTGVFFPEIIGTGGGMVVKDVEVIMLDNLQGYALVHEENRTVTQQTWLYSLYNLRTGVLAAQLNGQSNYSPHAWQGMISCHENEADAQTRFHSVVAMCKTRLPKLLS